MLTQQLPPRHNLSGMGYSTDNKIHYLPYVFSPPLTPANHPNSNAHHHQPHGVLRRCVNVALPYGACLPAGVSAIHKQPRKRRSIKELSRGYYCQEHGCPKRYEEWRSLQAHCWAKHQQRVRKNEKKWHIPNPTADYTAEEQGFGTPEATPKSSMTDLDDIVYAANCGRDFSPAPVSSAPSYAYSPANTQVSPAASSPLVSWSSPADVCFVPKSEQQGFENMSDSMALGALDEKEGSSLEVDFGQLDSLFLQIQRVLSEVH
eukprot:comp11905_c0_seq1/m.6555 comp11905_c0_seq1/g.6555  ORF comp11905_c0_seq1/g.6555 comp11905_c0_seq1/m.6555 type:complete len:261 (-) comp11905_c0_seq1:397-1179(-)